MTVPRYFVKAVTPVPSFWYRRYLLYLAFGIGGTVSTLLFGAGGTDSTSFFSQEVLTVQKVLTVPRYLLQKVLTVPCYLVQEVRASLVSSHPQQHHRMGRPQQSAYPENNQLST